MVMGETPMGYLFLTAFIVLVLIPWTLKLGRQRPERKVTMKENNHHMKENNRYKLADAGIEMFVAVVVGDPSGAVTSI